MRTTTIASCALPALLLGIVFAANAAQRPGPSAAVDAKTGKLLRTPTAQERHGMAQAVALRQRSVKQPRTDAEARPTMKRGANGLSMQVPTSLWSTLAVNADAQGKQHMLEYDGDQAPPADRQGGLEK